MTGRRPSWNRVGRSRRSLVLTREPPHRVSSRLTITAFCSLILEANSATSRHAKIDANVHYVPDPHSATGNDKNLVLLRKLPDFLQERQDHIATVIDDPVSSNLDYI